MPEFNRRQRAGTCKTCTDAGRGGEIRFYPKPLADHAAMVAETETEGEWRHLTPSDHMGPDLAHPVVPEELS